MMKLRKPANRSVSSMLVEPPESLKGLPSDGLLEEHIKWRHMMFVPLSFKLRVSIELISWLQTGMRREREALWKPDGYYMGSALCVQSSTRS